MRNSAIIQLNTLSRISNYASLVCAIECALSPFIIGALPLVGLGTFENEYIEQIFMTIAIGLSLIGLISGLIKHRRVLPLGLFFLSVSLILFAHTFSIESMFLEHVMIITGVAILIVFNILNRRYYHSNRGCCVATGSVITS